MSNTNGSRTNSLSTTRRPDTAERLPRVLDRRASRVPGEPGLWVLIFGDLSLFTVLFCVQLYYRGQQPEVFSDARGALSQTWGAANTILLLASSLFVVIAVRTVRTQRRAAAAPAIAGAWACGLLFICVKVAEYTELISAGMTPNANAFFTYYFILTGLHLFHLLVGMCILLSLFFFARRPSLSDRQFAYFEGGACYWHMVDLLWMILFALVYLMR